MSTSGLPERWKNAEYKNYLKVIEALLYVRDGVSTFAKNTMLKFQSDILNRNKIQKKDCQNKDCDAKKNKGSLKYICPNGICDKMVKEILSVHSSAKNPTGIFWANTQIRKWPTDEWEIAKIFMGRGQKENNNGPEQTDSAGILTLFQQCRCFKQYVTISEAAKLLTLRNDSMHSPTATVDQNRMKNNIRAMIDFLQKLSGKLLALKEDVKSINETVDKLEELMKLDFEIFLQNNQKSVRDEEVRLLAEVMVDYERRLIDVEESSQKLEEVRQLMPFLTELQKHADLMTRLEDRFQNLVSLSQLNQLDEKMCKLSEKTDDRFSRVEEEIEALTNRLDEMALSNIRSSVNYKGQLKNFLDTKKIVSQPVYSRRQDSTSNKWFASVTIMYGTENKTFECHTACTKLIDAEHNAASEALEALQKLPDTTIKDDEPKLEDPKKRLDEVLTRFEFKAAEYNMEDNSDRGVKKFKASVKIQVNCVFQKKFDDGSLKQSEKEQAAAGEALKVLGVDKEPDNSPKHTLYGWCGKKGFCNPSYYPKDALNYIFVFSTAFREKQTIEFEGKWCSSKKEAKSSVAEELIKLFDEVKLIDAWQVNTGKSVKLTAGQDENDLETSSRVTPAVTGEVCSEVSSVEKLQSICQNKKPAVTGKVSSEVSSIEKLQSICQNKNLDPPKFEVPVVKSDGQFKACVTMNYVFQPSDETVTFKNKADAENDAALIALEILKKNDKLDQAKKSFKSQLNEYCQQKHTDAPLYDTNGSGTCFRSKVSVKLVFSYPEAFVSELEAREFTAKNILKQLRLNSNYDLLKEECSKLGVEMPKETIKCNSDGKKCAVLDVTYMFTSEIPYPSKKEAHKRAACEALKILYPDVQTSDLDKCKNLLQEKRPHPLPIYDAVPTEDRSFLGKVIVSFEVEGSNWHDDEEDAKDEAYTKTLKKLGITKITL